MRAKLLLAVAAGAVAVWACCVAADRTAPPDLHKIAQCPDISIHAIDGGTVSLASLKGKVVLIDFWGTWCGPCRTAMPGLERMYEGKRAKGFEIIGVAMEHDHGENVAGVARALHVTYPVGVPANSDAAEQMLQHTQGLPFTVLVDRTGVIRNSQEGYAPAYEKRLEAGVDALLAE